MDVDQAGVAFAGIEGREDRVLAGFAAGHEVDRRGRGQVRGQQGAQFGELGFVAVSDDHATDQARAQEGLKRVDEDRLAGQERGDLVVDDGLHAPGRTRGEKDEDVVAGAHAVSPMSRRMRSVSAAGSLALRMGRPTTMKLAPAAAAWAGVMIRFWSSPAASG